MIVLFQNMFVYISLPPSFPLFHSRLQVLGPCLLLHRVCACGGRQEGMLFNASNSGDPLGYIPKGLRSKVNIVDTKTTSQADQLKAMQDYADGKGGSTKQPTPAGGGSARCTHHSTPF